MKLLYKVFVGILPGLVYGPQIPFLDSNMVPKHSYSTSMWLSILDSAVQFYSVPNFFFDTIFVLAYSLFSALCACVLPCTFGMWRLFAIFPTQWNIVGFHLMFLLLDECINLKDTNLNTSCTSWQSQCFWLSMDLYNGNMWAHRDQYVAC